MDNYATLAELRRLDGLGDVATFADDDLTAARAFGVEAVESYTGQRWVPVADTYVGDLVTVVGPPPVSIKWAARTIARQWAIDLHSRIPDRATSITTDYGQTNFAQAGGHWRPTSLPEVNAVLNRYRHRAPFA